RCVPLDAAVAAHGQDRLADATAPIGSFVGKLSGVTVSTGGDLSDQRRPRGAWVVDGPMDGGTWGPLLSASRPEAAGRRREVANRTARSGGRKGSSGAGRRRSGRSIVTGAGRSSDVVAAATWRITC